jgi:hypothetical protein
MLKKTWILTPAGLMTAGVCAAFVSFTLSSDPPGVTVDNSYRIRIGMTEEDVEALMGCPGKRWHHKDVSYLTWGDANCGNVVSFDENGKVTAVLVKKNTSTHLIEENESLFERLCCVLCLKKRERL